MKGIWKFFVGSLVGAFLGWSVGYLRMPMLDGGKTFVVGFLTCLAAVLFLLAVRTFIRSGRSSRSTNRNRRGRWLPWILTGLIAVAAGLWIFRVNDQHSAALDQLRAENTAEIREQAETIDALRSQQHVGRMAAVLEAVQQDLDRGPARSLSDTTIDRVAALSEAFRPYRSLQGDSLSPVPLSPERGQLFLALEAMGIDSASFARLKSKTTFAAADLEKAMLDSADLSGANLQGANLREAGLNFANLDSADLKGADLWGAHLDSASLRETILRRCDLQWAELNGADLFRANLNGVNIRNAKLRNASLYEALAQWAFFDASMLNQADLRRVDFLGTDMNMAVLSGANLGEANLMAVVLQNARLDSVDLSNTSCGANVLQDSLPHWNITNAGELQQKYKVIDDKGGRYVSSIFKIVEK